MHGLERGTARGEGEVDPIPLGRSRGAMGSDGKHQMKGAHERDNADLHMGEGGEGEFMKEPHEARVKRCCGFMKEPLA